MTEINLSKQFVEEFNTLRARLHVLENDRSGPGIPGPSPPSSELIARVDELEQKVQAVKAASGQKDLELQELKNQLLAVKNERDKLAKSKPVKVPDSEAIRSQLEAAYQNKIEEIEEKWKSRSAQLHVSHNTEIEELNRVIEELKENSSEFAPLSPVRPRPALLAEFQRLTRELQRGERELREYERSIEKCDDMVLSETVNMMVQESEKKRLRAVLMKMTIYGHK